MVASHHYQHRLSQFQSFLTKGSAALISKANDILYLTGFPRLAPDEREAFLLILPQKAILFHHSFTPVPINKTWLETVPRTELKTIAEYLEKNNTQTLFFDEHTLSVAEHQQLVQTSTSSLLPLNQQWIWRLRVQKDAQEIRTMRQAGKITAQIFQIIKKNLKPGLTERQLAQKITQLMLENQAEKPAFPTIVAFGPGSALPHYQPKEVKLTKETPVLIDLGVQLNGYCSDMTRTFWFGKQPTVEFQKIATAVKTAYQKTLKKLQNRTTKITAQDLDHVARTHLTNQGFGRGFIHTTGHGLGMEIHEPPSLSWKNEATIEPNTTITLEPGVYLPKKFGYRYENTVLVTAKSATVFTKPAK